jgi:hypothetical protein
MQVLIAKGPINSLKKRASFYAAILSVHRTEPQVRQGGKVSVFDKGIFVFSPFSLQKCDQSPDSGHFSPVRYDDLVAVFLAADFFSGMNNQQVLT